MDGVRPENSIVLRNSQRVHEEPRRDPKVGPVGKACQNAMGTEENDRGDTDGKVQETDSERGVNVWGTQHKGRE